MAVLGAPPALMCCEEGVERGAEMGMEEGVELLRGALPRTPCKLCNISSLSLSLSRLRLVRFFSLPLRDDSSTNN